MPYGNIVRDGYEKLKGVWWIASEDGPADAAFLDEWEQMLADDLLDDIRRQLPTAAPVMHHEDDDEVHKRDWLDVLIYEARPSLRISGVWVDGPFRIDAESAEDLLAWAKDHTVPDDAWVTDRIFVP